jgi:hypothetical protein
MIKSGRFGEVKWGVDEATSAVVASLNSWKLDLKTDKIDVTCFNDVNKVYVPGMRDISGSVAGFWNSDELALIEATDDDVPGFLSLAPNKNEATFVFSGLAYMDASIDTEVNGAPKLTGNFMAGGSWTLPVGTP